jgi:hypothetical protein
VRNAIAIGRIAASIGAVALVTALYSVGLQVNPTTVALSYLIAILLIATTWGIVEATTASVLAVLCFNFFFLPPVGTLTIADPQNWVAFVAFLATAVIASQLSGRAGRSTPRRAADLSARATPQRGHSFFRHGASVSGAIARRIARSSAAVGRPLRSARRRHCLGPTEIPAVETKREVASGAPACATGRTGRDCDSARRGRSAVTR